MVFEYGSGPPPPPPPPLSAYIAGPSEVPPNQSCIWQAIASGGSTPYSYQWSGVLSGSSSSVSGVVYNSGWLYLTVTDAAQNQAGDQLFVNIDEELEECEF